MKKPYRLHKRDGIWYYKLPNEKTFHSTGQTAKARADEHVLKLITGSKPKHITLSDYAKDFFDWDKCSWVNRQLKQGKHLTRLHVLNRQRWLQKYLIPKFGKRLLESLNPVEIENWLYNLPLAHQTLNHILYTLKTIIDEAEREGVIDKNPMRKVGRLSDQPKKRDVFTLAELTALFPDDPKKLIKIWENDMFATLYLLLASTGIRPGEARGLQWADVDLINGGLYIVRALDDQGEAKTPKSGEARVIPLPTRSWDALKAWKAKTFLPDPSDWVFYGVDKKPLSKKVVSLGLRPALKNAKIKIGDRNLVTYSLRHTFNTFAKKVLPISTLQ